MSTTSVAIERCTCDFCCKNEAYKWNACLRCGKDICYDCGKTVAKQYQHGVYTGGSGDGQYCNECDAILTKTGDDQRHNAYRAIRSLRNEFEAWSADFEVRKKKAEATLEALRKQS